MINHLVLFKFDGTALEQVLFFGEQVQMQRRPVAQKNVRLVVFA